MTNVADQKGKAQAYPSPISFADLSRSNTKEQSVYLRGIYNGKNNAYIWSTSSYANGRGDANQTSLFEKSSLSSRTTTLTFDRPVKKVLYNGVNNLRATRTKYYRFGSAIGGVVNRQSLRADGSRVAVIHQGTAFGIGIHVLDTTSMQPVSRIQAVSNPTAVIYCSGTNEVFMTDTANNGFFFNETTGAQLGATIPGLASTLAVSQDANYVYVLNTTQLRRIDKATRLLDPTTINHGVGSANKMEVAHNRIWIVGTADGRGYNLLTARGPGSLLPIIPTIFSGGSGSWIIPTPTRLFIVSNTNLCQTRQVNLATNQLYPEDTEIRPNVNLAFYHDNKIYIGQGTTWMVYDATPNSNNTLEFLYTTVPFNVGYDPTPNFSNFNYPVAGNIGTEGYVYVHDTNVFHKFCISPLSLTINGVSETRNAFTFATPSNTLEIQYSGVDTHDLYPEIHLLLSF